MKAIVVAAGMGRRLQPYTDDRPKTMVPIRGRTILGRQLAAYRAAGIEDIVVVRGYLGERITEPGVRFVDNPDFRSNNILASLMCAAHELDDDVVVSYADIVFHPDVVKTLLASPAEHALIVDREWARTYVGRTLHPISEAELVRLDPAGRIAALGKGSVPDAADAVGEFIGLARFSRAAARLLRDTYQRLATELRPEQPFVRAPRFQVAYLTDLLQHLVDQGTPMAPVFIDGQWREIDTTQDLESAERGGDFE